MKKTLKILSMMILVLVIGTVNINAATASNSYMRVSATIAPNRNFGQATVSVDPKFYGSITGALQYTAGFQVWTNWNAGSASGKGGSYTYMYPQSGYRIVAVQGTGSSNQNGVVRRLSTQWQQ